MLKLQKERAKFTGGLDPRLITESISHKLKSARLDSLFSAYDTPDDLKPLQEAGNRLVSVGFTPHSKLYCYVLCGYKGDTFDKAEKRFRETWDAGFMPYAMLYRDDKGEYDKEWRRLQRLYYRPAATRSILKSYRSTEEVKRRILLA